MEFIDKLLDGLNQYPHQLTPKDHFGPTKLDGETRVIDNEKSGYNPKSLTKKITNLVGNPEGHIVPPSAHFVEDDNTSKWHTGSIPENNQSYNPQKTSPLFRYENGSDSDTFSGSTTQLNSRGNKDKQAVMDYGLENAEIHRVNKKKPSDQGIPFGSFDGGKMIAPPISPLQPFTRMLDPDMAQVLNLYSYNRFHYPIADLEHRKSFRNLFFTRPECYIYSLDGITPKLSQQCELDDTIASSNSRYPHISKMLSPVYVTGTFGPDKSIMDNFNYLLSNRANGFSITEETLSVNESVGKSIEGYTVVPGQHIESQQGGTFSVSFTDTKYLEIYEYFRIWMAYIYKRKKGVLEPPFSRYRYKNDFPDFGSSELSTADKAYYLHPYDRALEYTASMFDMISNEMNDRILYWCKYLGIFPTSLSIEGLNSDMNAPMVDKITVNVTFRYQCKVVCENRSLVEFNFNAGITDTVGRVNKGSLDTVNGFIITDKLTEVRDTARESNNKQVIQNVPYMGAANMFVGTPYIVMGRFKKEPTKDNKGIMTVHPFLRFMPINNQRMNTYGNLNITSSRSIDNDGTRVVGTDQN